MSFTVVIPARFASTRLPGKPLELLAGKPMVQHVYERACNSRAERVIVATDDDRIEAACRAFGGEVCMTSAHHESGTDRLEEVARSLGMGHEEVIVNVQGDEPLMPPALINQVAERLTVQGDADMSTLCEPIRDFESLFNPNLVKVVRDDRGAALYFSRAPIPWSRDAGPAPGGERPTGPLPEHWSCFRHIGIYGYRVRLLHDFVRWSPAPLEKLESLEQLRALWHGSVIAVDEACEEPQPGVDTPQDLERLRQYLEATHG